MKLDEDFIATAEAKVLCVIEDHGIGFEYDEVKDSVNTAGIRWMNERLALLGGHLMINSIPGSGTRITARIPLKDNSHQV